MTQELKWIASMFHIDQTEYDFIENTLKEYDIGGYLIGHEETPYSHFHILFQGNDNIYNAFSKRLILKYNLRGKAGKDKTRQYGKIKAIKDLEKLKSYTIKDNNYRSNLSESEVNAYFEKSFKKKNHNELIDKTVLHMDELPNIFEIKSHQNNWDSTNSSCFDKIKMALIDYCLINDLKITRPFINNTVTTYLSKSLLLTKDKKRQLIYRYICA